jgi:hypothetical protein
MALNLTARASGRSAMRAINRVWDFSPIRRFQPLGNGRRLPEPRWKPCSTLTIFTSGIPQWPSRDPIGENWATWEYNEYAFIRNLSIHHYDILGLFGDGGYVDGDKIEGHRPVRDMNTGRIRQEPIWEKKKSKFKGHKDFDNLKECGFDYSKEDHQISTFPLFNPSVHFQTREESVRQVTEAIGKCDPKAFQSAMHRLQDYYSHRGKDYQWDPIKGYYLPGYGWGHITEMGDDAWLPPEQRSPGYNGSPDNDDTAWNKANEDTKDWLKEWKKNCCIKCKTKCEWVPKSVGPCAPKQN